mgnify:CR=1 FL=1
MGRASSAVSAAYMVGCDGGNSLVRRQFDIKLNGEANIQQLRQALYYCDDLYERIPIGKGRHYHVADAEGSFLIVQDSTRHFTLHSVVDKDEDMATMFERTVAMPVQYEMLYVGEWRQNLLVSERYTEGRVLLDPSLARQLWERLAHVAGGMAEVCLRFEVRVQRRLNHGKRIG